MAGEGELEREMIAHRTDYSKFIWMMKWGAILSFVIGMLVVFIIA